MKSQNKRFADISKQSLRIHTLARKACEIGMGDDRQTAKALVALAGLIEELLDLISRE